MCEKNGQVYASGSDQNNEKIEFLLTIDGIITQFMITRKFLWLGIGLHFI
jgi:hypothetical protein